jgi:membrane protein YdbS with pleckstrin-like domain
LGLILVLWFYIALIKLSLKVLRAKSLQEGIFISAVWVNAIYHLFTLFWVPINAIFYIFLALVEKN